MYFKDKEINGKKYRYALKSVRLPDGKIKVLEKRFKGETKEELNKIFNKKSEIEHLNYMLFNFRTDHIFTQEQFARIEEIRLGYLKLLRKLPKKNFKDLLDRFTANFTYESNALEGNSLTLKDVAMVMFENVSIKGKDLREIYETRNSRRIIEMIFKKEFDLTNEDIIRMHRLLVKDTGINAGYKKFPNMIVGKNIRLIPPEKVYEEISELLKWVKENKGRLHPLKLAALLHGKFEKIHPFEDGNGRVGRFLINVILANNKYPPLIIRKSQRLAYLTALEKFDKGHSDNLERFILQRFKDTYRKFFEIYIRYV
ncbi:Fic family protein [Candidatus Pacearchaeota archaeon]|nr:Fic family protein [Candidatus Pacearchaeota archaeon]